MKSKNILELILPEKILEWFDVAGGTRDDNQIKIILEKKYRVIFTAIGNNSIARNNYSELF